MARVFTGVDPPLSPATLHRNGTRAEASKDRHHSSMAESGFASKLVCLETEVLFGWFEYVCFRGFGMFFWKLRCCLRFVPGFSKAFRAVVRIFIDFLHG